MHYRDVVLILGFKMYKYNRERTLVSFIEGCAFSDMHLHELLRSF